ncbi:helix-turn-helix transcriptional regulator [Neptuniibacter marinus]|uniref:helix-turn-helix transcriptional regulator n=1 Tax=Neptuniibacter marinus TaxID=1806670 RepID=UPI003B5CD408
MENFISQLKKEPAFQETSVLAFECTWEKLLHEIDELLTQLGFVYFTYSVLTRGVINPSSESQKQRWDGGSDIVGSLPDAVVKSYYKDIAQHDPLWNVLPSITSPFLVSSLEGGQGTLSENFWLKQGISSRAYIPMKDQSSRYWFHYFSLFHKLPPQEFDVFFNRISEWLVPMLSRYHELLQVVCEQEQNPYLKSEVLSPTCRQVILMTAQGMPVKRIADKLALTEEGVTYHITRAKKIFGAKNKTHLVAMMYEVGLL